MEILLLLLLALQPLQGQLSEVWSQFRGNPQLTGVAASAPPSSLKVLWSYDVKDSIDSSAAIANGVVYVGAGNGDLIAVDFATGKLRWKYSTQSFLGESSPAVAAGIVYIGDLDGTFHAVDAGSGKSLWTFKTGGEIKSSPVVVNGIVLIGSYDAHLYALNARTGELRWKVLTEGMVHATPAIQGELLFIAGCDENFRAIRITDGKQAYIIRGLAYTGASPLVAGDRAYFGTFSNEVLALDLKTRKVVWRYRAPDREFPFYSSAVLSNGNVILGAGTNSFTRSTR